jgi:predicted acetyltransferase
MKIEVVPAQIEDREILSNLLEKYDYEFSQYDDRDVNKLGLYGYKYLDCYWLEENRWAYFIKADGKLAGLVFVTTHAEVDDIETDFSICEFFVMYKYRRKGVGKQAFFQVLEKHKGRWQLRLHPKNTASVHFWGNVINEYTKGEYKLEKSHQKAEYCDGTPADVFFFSS